MVKTKSSNKRKKPQSACAKKIRCRNFHFEGTRYRTLLTKKFENRKMWKKPDPKKILSYIPGTIQKVFVKEGQDMKEGDPLLILEAMKMRNVVSMPEDGKIKKLNVQTGDKIPKGHLIIEIE